MDKISKSICVTEMPSGEIALGTPAAEYLGFAPDKFEGCLWHRDNRITISLIISKHPRQGNLSRLFSRILSLGYEVAVPTPSIRMRNIVEAKGFLQTWEWSDLFEEDVELWVKRARADTICAGKE